MAYPLVDIPHAQIFAITFIADFPQTTTSYRVGETGDTRNKIRLSLAI